MLAAKWRVHVVLFQEIYVDTAIKFSMKTQFVSLQMLIVADHKEKC